MSGRSGAVMFVFVMAIALAANRAEDATSVANPRKPASAKPALPITPKVAVKHTHKLSGPVQVSLELVGSPPSGAGDIFVLKGVATSREALSTPLNFKWILPGDVELVNGSTEGVIDSLDKPFEMQLTLRQLSSGNAQVHLEVTGTSGARRFGHTAQYNTLLEDAFRDANEELLKSTEKHAEQDRPKIMQ